MSKSPSARMNNPEVAALLVEEEDGSTNQGLSPDFITKIYGDISLLADSPLAGPACTGLESLLTKISTQRYPHSTRGDALLLYSLPIKAIEALHDRALSAAHLRSLNQLVPGIIYALPMALDALVEKTHTLMTTADKRQEERAIAWLKAVCIPRKDRARPELAGPQVNLFPKLYAEVVLLKKLDHLISKNSRDKAHRISCLREVYPTLSKKREDWIKLILNSWTPSDNEAGQKPVVVAEAILARAVACGWGPQAKPYTSRYVRRVIKTWLRDFPYLRKQIAQSMTALANQKFLDLKSNNLNPPLGGILK